MKNRLNTTACTAPRAALLRALLPLAFAAATATPVLAQRATEGYIPIGQSPGISGKTAMMGTIISIEGEMLTVASPAYPSPQRMRLLPASRIWVDRSAARQPNVAGAATDLRPGRRVEVKFTDSERRDAIDWVKVEAATP